MLLCYCRIPFDDAAVGFVAKNGEHVVTNDPGSDRSFYNHPGIQDDNFVARNMIIAPIIVHHEYALFSLTYLLYV